MKNIFIIGSKGIPGAYGGFETFVDKLTEYHMNSTTIKYHIACKANNNDEIIYHNARCFNIKVPNIGAAQAIYYDVMALKKCCEYIEEKKINNFIIYILACRIGPFMSWFHYKVQKLGGEVYLNPDGHEWLRGKWPWLVKRYWKISEKMMVKHSDLLICDSKNIEKYIVSYYSKYNPKTKYIAYGAEARKSILNDNDLVLLDWYREKNVIPKQYYLIVGRLVPENNYETIINEFINSNTKRELVLITNENEKFLTTLKMKTNFQKDNRIKFVGTVYNQELLMKIRENAYAYIHGHEVGGTNPSLLEALRSTQLNLLLNVGFNKEVAEKGALYWDKNIGNLTKLMNECELMSLEEIEIYDNESSQRIDQAYSWDIIAEQYREVFM